MNPPELIHAPAPWSLVGNGYVMVDGSAFPDFTRGRVLGTLSVPKFLMASPEATIL